MFMVPRRRLLWLQHAFLPFWGQMPGNTRPIAFWESKFYVFFVRLKVHKEHCWERKPGLWRDKTGNDWREMVTRWSSLYLALFPSTGTSQYEQLVAHGVKGGLPKSSATIPADWGTASEHSPECTWYRCGQWESLVWGRWFAPKLFVFLTGRYPSAPLEATSHTFHKTHSWRQICPKLQFRTASDLPDRPVVSTKQLPCQQEWVLTHNADLQREKLDLSQNNSSTVTDTNVWPNNSLLKKQLCCPKSICGCYWPKNTFLQ